MLSNVRSFSVRCKFKLYFCNWYLNAKFIKSENRRKGDCKNQKLVSHKDSNGKNENEIAFISITYPITFDLSILADSFCPQSLDGFLSRTGSNPYSDAL